MRHSVWYEKCGNGGEGCREWRLVGLNSKSETDATDRFGAPPLHHIPPTILQPQSFAPAAYSIFPSSSFPPTNFSNPPPPPPHHNHHCNGPFCQTSPQPHTQTHTHSVSRETPTPTSLSVNEPTHAPFIFHFLLLFSNQQLSISVSCTLRYIFHL